MDCCCGDCGGGHLGRTCDDCVDVVLAIVFIAVMVVYMRQLAVTMGFVVEVVCLKSLFLLTMEVMVVVVVKHIWSTSIEGMEEVVIVVVWMSFLHLLAVLSVIVAMYECHCVASFSVCAD